MVRILFGLVRDRCSELGCIEGTRLTCTDVDPGGVSFVDQEGRPAWLEREYAWFVEVEDLGPGDVTVN